MSEKIGRNSPCPCESGKKYKKCCLNAKMHGPIQQRIRTPEEKAESQKLMAGLIGFAAGVAHDIECPACEAGDVPVYKTR